MPPFRTEPNTAWDVEGERTHPAYTGQLSFSLTNPYKVFWTASYGSEMVSWTVNIGPLGCNGLLRCILQTSPKRDIMQPPSITAFWHADTDTHEVWMVKVMSAMGIETEIKLFQREWGSSASSSRDIKAGDDLEQFSDWNEIVFF